MLVSRIVSLEASTPKAHKQGALFYSKKSFLIKISLSLFKYFADDVKEFTRRPDRNSCCRKLERAQIRLRLRLRNFYRRDGMPSC